MLQTKKVKSMALVTLCTLLDLALCLSKTRINKYSEIATKMLHWTPVIQTSTMLKPRLGGASIDPYIYIPSDQIIIFEM